MREFNRIHFILVICLTLLCGLFTKSSAHDIWIEADDFTPDSGKGISIKLAYDHRFPAIDILEEKNLKEIYMLDPASKKISIKKSSETEYKAIEPPKEKGAYLIAAAQNARFWTKTIEGYKSDQSRKALENVISCTYSLKFGKGIINLGTEDGKSLFHPVGHDLEIVPMANPAKLHPGEILPVQILLKGKPLASSFVYATYKGFSTEKDTYAFTTKTDSEGTAKIKILKRGIWLVATSYSEDYPDQGECDTSKYSATLTFELK
ncbi:MAG: DUF4198 domain-containing protein [Desulfobacteraceae bacterium]|jgi:uncharacterized GH25 family protein